MTAPTVYPGIPYIEAASYGGPRNATRLVVIHATDNTASAFDEAKYAAVRTDGTSTHLFVDADSAYQVVPLPNIAYGCFPHGNAISVQIELCGLSNRIGDATMRRAAPYVAQLCAWYGLPVRKLIPDEVRAAYYTGFPSGICGHADVTIAFPEDGGDHTDPGAVFPWNTFIAYVGGHMSFMDDPDFKELAFRIEAFNNGRDFTVGGPIAKEAVWPVQQIRTLLADMDALKSTMDDLKSTVDGKVVASAADIAAAIIAQLRGQ
jgi:N-acetyl-anhydromuramyl-L-alanine amidase AmpD